MRNECSYTLLAPEKQQAEMWESFQFLLPDFLSTLAHKSYQQRNSWLLSAFRLLDKIPQNLHGPQMQFVMKFWWNACEFGKDKLWQRSCVSFRRRWRWMFSLTEALKIFSVYWFNLNSTRGVTADKELVRTGCLESSLCAGHRASICILVFLLPLENLTDVSCTGLKR